jgi:hypothetical protein
MKSKQCIKCNTDISPKNKNGKCRPCYKKEYEYIYCINRYNTDIQFAHKQKQRSTIYQKNNLDKVLIYNKSYRKKRETHDVGYKLSNSLRSRLTHAVSNKQKSGSAVRDLGCSIEELRLHLESKFQPGMNWKNYGRSGWHIDHVIPLSSFDLLDRDQLLKACHYTNLQPLWAQDNLIKGAKSVVPEK